MSFGNCTDPVTGESTAMPLSNAGGGNDLDITKWGARKINLTIPDVQESIQEGIQYWSTRGGMPLFNISGNTIPGSQV